MNTGSGVCVALAAGLVFAFGLATTAAQTSEQARTRQLYRAGLWTAFGGAAEDQRAVCGISTAGADGRRVAIQQYAGESDLHLVLEKPSWSIPEGTPIDLAVQFDNNPEQPDRGSGAGNRVTLQMPFDRSIGFMRSMRGGYQVRVYFPNGNEAPWTGGLSGSSAVIDVFNDCRSALAPAAPTQPFRPGPDGSPLAGPTQPFSSLP